MQSLCKVNKKIACMLLHLRVCSVCTCQVHRFKSALLSHAHAAQKSHERLALSANCSLKGGFDVWKWRWASLKERPTGGGAMGGESCGMCDSGCFPDSSIYDPETCWPHDHLIYDLAVKTVSPLRDRWEQIKSGFNVAFKEVIFLWHQFSPGVTADGSHTASVIKRRANIGQLINPLECSVVNGIVWVATKFVPHPEVWGLWWMENKSSRIFWHS